jgi:hypothetical protein
VAGRAPAVRDEGGSDGGSPVVPIALGAAVLAFAGAGAYVVRRRRPRRP